MSNLMSKMRKRALKARGYERVPSSVFPPHMCPIVKDKGEVAGYTWKSAK